MSSIPVAIVDDEDADRYIARRKLTKAGEFDPVYEASNGSEFLEAFFNGKKTDFGQGQPLVVLMDINMPVMNGFQTIEEIQRRMEAGRGPDCVDIIMFSSSTDPDDRARAEGLKSVKGYLVKPLDDAGIAKIRALYPA